MFAMHQAWPAGSLPRRSTQEGQIPPRCPQRSPHVAQLQSSSSAYTRYRYYTFGPVLVLPDPSRSPQFWQFRPNPVLCSDQFALYDRFSPSQSLRLATEHGRATISLLIYSTNAPSSRTRLGNDKHITRGETSPIIQCSTLRPRRPLNLQLRHFRSQLRKPLWCSGVWYVGSHVIWCC